MSRLLFRPKLKFSLLSLLLVMALAGVYFGGRTAQRSQLRELEIERNELRERVAKLERRENVVVQNNGWVQCYWHPVNPVALKVQNGEVELSIGTDDGAKPGVLFDLRREEAVTATVKVIRATADRSVAMPCLPDDLARIRRGDHAIMR
ncbi:MAG: hypothetical protein SFU86_24070 [Pirellulaceae bacterium]|nr:hypothetical protein [Pirellulaceae bacterium]